MDSYTLAVEQLYALGHELQHGPARKFELEQMRRLSRALGEPQQRFPSVLIAGTNGKGSTAATLASILQCSGMSVGLYTSPHLVRINERIAIGGEPVGDEQFAAAWERVHQVASALVERGELPQHPSFFESVTAMAFLIFAEAGVELAVLEVGMGGRLDATNIVEPRLSIITDIDLDHQKFLGDSLTAIAREKAGILRPGIAAITLPQHPEATQALGECMQQTGARAVSATCNLAGSPADAPTCFAWQVLGEEVQLRTPLAGRHQLRNLALAITAAEELAAAGFPVTAATIAEGVRTTRWPGRFQRMAATATRPETVMDVAHNPAGAWALRSALSEQLGERPLVMLFGVMTDKDYAPMAQILWPTMRHVVLTQAAGNPRAATVEELARLAAHLGVEHSLSGSVAEGLRRAQQLARQMGSEAVVVIAGSIYVAGEAMMLL
jgi:dihydrofolate synthase/folylpolyglutamate synthase